MNCKHCGRRLIELGNRGLTDWYGCNHCQHEVSVQIRDQGTHASIVATQDILALDPIKTLRGMLADWEDQFGGDACDCPHEPYNKHILCHACQARQIIAEHDSRSGGANG